MNAKPDRHLLVVDDDDRIRNLLKEFLTRAGFRVTVAPHGEAAGRLMQTLDFDLLVLDVMMPGEDGFAFTRRVRSQAGEAGRTPILMLTAKGEGGDRIEGLTAGADDYLPKPFEPQELLLRIEAILRRAGPRDTGPQVLTMGRCAFDSGRGELTRDGAPIRLTEAEVELLRTLARAANAPVDRWELARDTADASGRAVDVQVTRLRRKIEDDPKNPRYLQTVRGVGYRLAPD
ncbi:two-component system phosphate regulon response regulator OmpR [Caulobacter ginsengisoli]|uniref:Two-component system phosphate regulon response regulator OmpR n=1 Tax=Caulobacter ginsengisoli TaxID=400775 RepID=A0ABU0IYL1_9CAUL|nr:response regulator [Caulobacter ginsengisoli]MDQ0466052.1 two-component system phosphate regulon response regulator OmpR [Caulobacter ginsengisoli]